ncbi:RodZ domain-containing protein [Thiocystis violacea]|uniref:RodZ domain-containing protein n=1 Tax=Thiocystis violacea TaxID=13725 RepID=UPI0019054FF2|nr:RodZ domain-containing protein [Thiocystis violacea]MBK1722350.1 hypothetical protein [Thiocystis violacea]
MSQPTNMQSDDQNPGAFAASPGGRLRALRQSRGMEIERVAAQLHLERSVVEALESDQLDELPSPVFVAGYLRNYARLLGADPNPIIDAYRSLSPEQDAPIARTVQRQPPKKPARSGGIWIWGLSILLAGAAVGAAALWWQGRGAVDADMSALQPSASDSLLLDADQSATGASDETATSANAPLAESGEAETAAPVDSFGSTVAVPPDAIPLRRPIPSTPATTGVTTETTDTAAATSASGIIPAESLPTGTPPAAEPAPAQAPVSQEVVLQFSGTSWVDVRDAAGEVVLNGEMRAGDRRVLTGEPPYKLVIGNAAATQLLVGDKPLDLGSRAQGNVARFSLDPKAETE